MNARASTVLSAAVATSVLLGGCVSDGPAPRPAPRPPAVQPSGIMPSVVDVAATRYARDSDKNGFADEINATAFLFAPPHNTPITVGGSFTFTAKKLDGTDFATWKFDQGQAKAAIEKLLPGPGYRFRLSMLDRGTDQMDSEDVQLWCEFTPEGGEPIRSRSPIRVTIGKLR